MILALRLLAWFCIALLVAAALWVFGPRAPVDREISFDAESLPEDLDAYLAHAEAQFGDLREGVARRIHWHGAPGTKTPLSVVYLHGYSATSEEIRPVPDQVATALGANLHFARLTGHGRSGDAMADAQAGDWIEDTAEALAIGRRIGARVVVIATSTGGTLAALAAQDTTLSDRVAGVVLISPNFQVNRPDHWLLNGPWARWWLPLVAGARRSWEPQNPEQARYWTYEYPMEAVVPMAALVDHARALEWSAAEIPALFVYAEADRTVAASATDRVVAAWGGPTTVLKPVMGPNDDPGAHVIAGDILSPDQTAPTVEAILAWARDL